MKLLYLFIIATLTACRPTITLPDNIAKAASENATELQKVIDHYENDSLRLQAAMFLLQNMPGHHTATGKLFESYKERLRQSQEKVPLRTLNQWWEALEKQQPDQQIEHSDAETLTAGFLINHIDGAFRAWLQAAWKEEITFDLFCRYILPYRFLDEELAAESRDSLYRIYHPLIANEPDMRKAFAILQNHVWREVGSGSSTIPYTINVLDMRRQQRATCQQRCILLGSAARAVGLPVALDHVHRWSNYSRTGHSWVSLVTREGTYTVYGKDSVARLHNPIDASSFKSNRLAKSAYPYDSRFAKRTAKVWRTGYAVQTCLTDPDWEGNATEAFRDSFRMDVSAAYHFNGRVSGTVSQPLPRNVYLCTFSTGNDWEPAACCLTQDSTYTFAHVGEDVVYLPALCTDDEIQPLEAPFILSAKGKRSLTPDLKHRQRLVLTRKYPLTGNFLNTWSTLIGSRLEGSNQADFHTKDILATLTTLPAYENKLRLSGIPKYRYIRFVAAGKSKVPLTELICTSHGRTLTGTPFCDKARNPQNCMDQDTYTALGSPDSGYSVGMDFGEPVAVTGITYYPKNDGNNIIPGGRYELFYYDKEWVSLGEQTAKGHQLVYDHAPANALFLLRRHDKGNEERIFTYEDHRQVWW